MKLGVIYYDQCPVIVMDVTPTGEITEEDKTWIPILIISILLVAFISCSLVCCCLIKFCKKKKTTPNVDILQQQTPDKTGNDLTGKQVVEDLETPIPADKKGDNLNDEILAYLKPPI